MNLRRFQVVTRKVATIAVRKHEAGSGERGEVLAKALGEERRHRDGPSRMRLRGSHYDAAADLGHRLFDPDALSQRIDGLNPEGRGLPEPDSRPPVHPSTRCPVSSLPVMDPKSSFPSLGLPQSQGPPERSPSGPLHAALVLGSDGGADGPQPHRSFAGRPRTCSRRSGGLWRRQFRRNLVVGSEAFPQEPVRGAILLEFAVLAKHPSVARVE